MVDSIFREPYEQHLSKIGLCLYINTSNVKGLLAMKERTRATQGRRINTSNRLHLLMAPINQRNISSVAIVFLVLMMVSSCTPSCHAWRKYIHIYMHQPISNIANTLEIMFDRIVDAKMASHLQVLSHIACICNMGALNFVAWTNAT